MGDNPKRVHVEGGFLDKAYNAKSDEETRAMYDAWAKVYDLELSENDYQQPARCTQALLRHLQDRSARILDVGCGTGLSGLALKEAGFSDIDGCDYSEGMLGKAAKTNAYDRLFNTNLNEPPMDVTDATYDAATAVGIFSFGHVEADAIDEILRTIKPGGPLIIGMNDHYFQEGSVPDKLAALQEAGVVTVHSQEHGAHIKGTGLEGWVIALSKSS